MIAVVLHHPKRQGKTYRIATENDMRIFEDAEEYLKKKREKLMAEWGMDPVPDESLKRVPLSFGVINVWVYGMNTWGDLFNARQKLALITFVEKVRKSHDTMLVEGYEAMYAKALASYLTIGLNRLADYNSVICVWHTTKEILAHTFGRQSLGMIWNYVEVNPFSDSTGNWIGSFEYLLRVIEHCSLLAKSTAIITQSSAISLLYADNFFDAVFTDPPYYDNVPYSYLSDFFYISLKRTLGNL